eukprot:COSAG02_NODE_60450_length_271_cov_0.709302_2_plen_38_part_01
MVVMAAQEIPTVALGPVSEAAPEVLAVVAAVGTTPKSQ